MAALSFTFDRMPQGGAAQFARPVAVIRADTVDEIGPAFADRAAVDWLRGLVPAMVI